MPARAARTSEITLITITANTEIADRRTGPPRVTSE